MMAWAGTIRSSGRNWGTRSGPHWHGKVFFLGTESKVKTVLGKKWGLNSFYFLVGFTLTCSKLKKVEWDRYLQHFTFFFKTHPLSLSCLLFTIYLMKPKKNMLRLKYCLPSGGWVRDPQQKSWSRGTSFQVSLFLHFLLSPSFTSPFSCVFTRISFVCAVMLRSPLSIFSSLKSIESISHSLICKMFFLFASGTTGVTKHTAVWTLLGLRALHYKFVCDLNKYTSAR